MSTYYAVCDANGPISVRLEAETEGAAVLEFRRADTRSWIDAPRTDAEDDLGIEGEGMESDYFTEELGDHGLALIMGLDADLLGGWSLWRRVPRAVRIIYDCSTGTITIMPSAEPEPWDDVLAVLAETGGEVSYVSDLTGWYPYARLARVYVPIGGGWEAQHYMVEGL